MEEEEITQMFQKSKWRMDCYAEADFLTLLNPERDIPSDIVIKVKKINENQYHIFHKLLLKNKSGTRERLRRGLHIPIDGRKAGPLF